jgi:hypothetical protein
MSLFLQVSWLYYLKYAPQLCLEQTNEIFLGLELKKKNQTNLISSWHLDGV